MRGPAGGRICTAGKAGPYLRVGLVHGMERLFVEGQIGWPKTKTPRLIASRSTAIPAPGAPAIICCGRAARWSGRLDGRRLRTRLILPLRPGDIVSDDGHDRYSRHADKELGEQRTRTQHEFEMSNEGQEYPDAENRKRLLTADDHRIEHF